MNIKGLKKTKMYGALIGNIIGSTYEIKNIKYCLKQEDFIKKDNRFTDDAIMTIAVAKGICDCICENWVNDDSKIDEIKFSVYNQIKILIKKYTRVGFGGEVIEWINSNSKEPYNTWENNCASRISYCGWASNTEEEVKILSRICTQITNTSEEAIKGATVVAMCIFLLRNGANKKDIYEYVMRQYDLNFKLKDIRDDYIYENRCSRIVPQAIEAFLEGESFVDVISRAISIGGDSDTIATIAGSIAEAYYEIPDFLIEYVDQKLDNYLKDLLDEVRVFI